MTPLQEHYQAAAIEATRGMSLGSLQQMVLKAADAAVKADRLRMAEQLRARIIHRPSPSAVVDINPEADLPMKLDEVMFDLANQIENGMPFTEGVQ